MQKKSLNTLSMASLMALATATSTWACNASHVLGTGNAATAYTISANTMQKGSLYLGINAETVRNNTLSDASILAALNAGSEHLHNIDAINSYSLSLSYGISDKLSLNVQLPYSTRTNIRAGEDDGGGPEVHPHADSKGLGDASALLQYQIYDKAVKVSVLAGVKMPTGKSDLTEGAEVLEADLQPGSGSWDIFAGAAITKDFDVVSLHSDLLYKYNNKGVADSQLGDVVTYNLALSYKLIDHQQHPLDAKKDTDYALSTFIELNGETAKADRFAGVTAQNTGHDVIFATTGLQLATHEKYSLFLSISKPVYQNFHGVQNDIDYKASFGIGKSF